MYKRINENEIEVYKSGIYENHKDYKSFLPSKINSQVVQCRQMQYMFLLHIYIFRI